MVRGEYFEKEIAPRILEVRKLEIFLDNLASSTLTEYSNTYTSDAEAKLTNILHKLKSRNTR